MEEKIDYNDLVNSIEDSKDGSANKDSLEQSSGDRNIHTNPGKVFCPFYRLGCSCHLFSFISWANFLVADSTSHWLVMDIY